MIQVLHIAFDYVKCIYIYIHIYIYIAHHCSMKPLFGRPPIAKVAWLRSHSCETLLAKPSHTNIQPQAVVIDKRLPQEAGVIA